MGTQDDQPTQEVTHYHGNAIRILFMIAALIMLLGMTHAITYLQLPITISVISVVILVYAGGITNPSQVWPMYLDAIISTAGLLVFESYSIKIWRSPEYNGIFFVINEILAVIFLFALYYSTRTLRWFIVKNK